MSAGEASAVVLVPIAAPSAIDAGNVPAAPEAPLTPEQRISIYDDQEWEEFIREWVQVVGSEYLQVLRFGGTGDHGLDVVGLTDDAGLEGVWDCYQCKHYNRPLTPGDARAEIVKIVSGAINAVFSWPRAYRFLAPKGVGTSLKQLLYAPERLRADVIARLQAPQSPLVASLHGVTVDDAVDYIQAADFTVFGSVELHEVVDAHSGTRWHTARFAVDLPHRPDPQHPPVTPDPKEHRYIEQLMAVYNERYGGIEITPENVAGHAGVGSHYPRQREAFYSAETLRVFARDAVPDGTFESLKEEVYDGVVETESRAHPDGFERLSNVLEVAMGIQITSNLLLPRTTVTDRKGICHHLANEDRLTWCEGDHAAPE